MFFLVILASLLVMLVGIVMADQLSQEARRREQSLKEVDEMIARDLKAEQELALLEQDQKDRYLY